QQVPGVRGEHFAAAALTVDRERVELHVLDPEALFDRTAQRLSTFAPGSALRFRPPCGRQVRHRHQRRVGVALYLDHGHRSARHPTVDVKDRVVAVFPPLVDESRLRTTRIVEEAAGAGVEAMLDPGGRIEQALPDAVDQLTITGTLLVGAG